MSSFESELRLGDAVFEPDPLPVSGRRFDLEADGDSGESAPPEAAVPDPEELARQAFEQGREAGRSELPWREAERLAGAVKACEEGARQLAVQRRDYLQAQRRLVVELAMVVAEHVVGRGLLESSDDLLFRIERALAGVEDEAARVLLAPADLDVLRTGHADALARLEEDGCELLADEALATGDVRVLAGAREVDARTETILRRARRELLEAVTAEETGPVSGPPEDTA